MARSSRSNRNRVLDDRLWDTDGREWLLDLLAERLSREAIEAYVNSGRRIVVHQYREPLRWPCWNQARTYWRSIKEHTWSGEDDDEEVPPDEMGLTYRGVEWRSDGHVLLGIDASC
ncbi:MAG TPA: hypothetical protein VG455_09585 [Acidimicrobiales bacterium]|nr:hypothetical protein [Acidimicrobiales bacterium]